MTLINKEQLKKLLIQAYEFGAHEARQDFLEWLEEVLKSVL